MQYYLREKLGGLIKWHRKISNCIDQIDVNGIKVHMKWSWPKLNSKVQDESILYPGSVEISYTKSLVADIFYTVNCYEAGSFMLARQNGYGWSNRWPCAVSSVAKVSGRHVWCVWCACSNMLDDWSVPRTHPWCLAKLFLFLLLLKVKKTSRRPVSF